MSNKTVLTFSFQPDDLPRLKELPCLKALASGRASTRQVNNVFFDTPDHRLHGSATTLWVQKAAGRYFQCLAKGDGRFAGGAVAPHWEGAIPTEDPVVPAIRDDEVRALVNRDGSAWVEEVFRAEFRRTSRPLVLADGAGARVHMDIGAIAVGGATEPLCELTLETEDGAPHHLFELATEILAQVPIRLCTTSRAKRGYRLVSGAPPGWEKDTKVGLSTDATVEEALAHTVRHCLDHMLANEACVLLDDHPEGIHQMRVALRRLRSALRLFRPVLPAEQYLWLAGEVKWLTGELGPTRDWDVFRDEIVGPVAQHQEGDEGFAFLLKKIDGERRRSRRASRQAIGSGRYTGLLLGLGTWLARRGWRDQPLTEEAAVLFGPINALSDTLMSKRHRKVRKEGRRFDSMTIDERHMLRIDVKKLRYAGNFFASLYSQKQVAPFAENLSKLQDALGYLNDVAVARTLVERLCSSCDGPDALLCQQAGGIVIGWHSRALADIEDTLSTEVARFVKCKPFWTGS
jgi:triphosphatase